MVKSIRVILSRNGYGIQYFYQPGVQHELTSDPIESYATYFANNIPSSVNCLRTIGNNTAYGSCSGNGPRDFNFRSKSSDAPNSFLNDLDKVVENSINYFDQAEQIANRTYDVAFGEEIFDRSERTQPETQIVQEETPKRIQLVPVESEYVAIKNANVRQEPYVGSPALLKKALRMCPEKLRGRIGYNRRGERYYWLFVRYLVYG